MRGKQSVLILVLCLYAFSSFGFALEMPLDGEIHILADHLEYDQQTERLKGHGNVRVQYGELTFTSDEIDFSIPDGLVLAYGDVQLSPDSRYQIQSDSLRFDTASRLFSVQNSRVFMEPSYSFTARQIVQTSEREIVVSRASYTACDSESPAWRISCSRGTVELGQSAKMKNIVFRVKDTPLLYLPYFWFPVNQEKAAGFLTPDLGQSSGLGYYIQNYFYWPIRDWTDILFPLDYYEKRGVGAGLEYRYALSESDFGHLRAYGIWDRQESRQRGDVSLQLQQSFAVHSRGVADVTAMSDDDYYRDFRQETSKRYSQFLQSRAFVETTADPWNSRVLADSTTYLQEGPNILKTPEVDLSSRIQSFGNLPLFLQWESSWAHLQIKDANRRTLQAQRVDFAPRFFSPLSGRYLTLAPSFYYRKTCYYQQDEQEGTMGKDLYGAGLDLAGPKFYRRYYSRMGHIFYPRINLTCETLNQDEEYDGSGLREEKNLAAVGVDHLDRLKENRDVTLSLINRVWEKGTDSEQSQIHAGLNGRESTVSGQERLSLIISQKYSFQRELLPYQKEQGQKRRDGFTDFEVEASLFPFHTRNTNRFEMKYRYDLDIGRTRLMNFQWSYGFFQTLFNLGWRYSRLDDPDEGYQDAYGQSQDADSQNQDADGLDQNISILQGDWQSPLSFYPLSSRWIARVAFYYDLKSGIAVENQYGLTYEGGCWSIQMEYSHRFDGQRWNVKITLESLGEVGL
ncbi:MAG: LPS assembly protein LptD [bacterium]